MQIRALIVLLITPNLSCTSKSPVLDIINDSLLNTQKVYLVFRGTNTKEGYLASNFNIKYKKASHVGIAVFINNKWKIYHVINSVDKEKKDFRASDFITFFNDSEENIKHASVWEINHLRNSERIDLITEIKRYESLPIVFDKSFSLDSTKLYCSEFINNVLFKINKNKFKFKIHKKKLNSIQSKILKRDTLYYYPVDVFQLNRNINIIKEWNSN